MSIENVVITGSGKYIPELLIDHNHFASHQFYSSKGDAFSETSVESAIKLENITGINERRYAKKNVMTSDMAYLASLKAIEEAGVEKEEIDQIIFAHNFGDLGTESVQGDLLPSLATRLKNKLNIDNPNCVAYDVIFGCPGWVQGLIQAYSFIKSGMAKTCLVVGAETLSRVIDPFDRDSMIYADGAGAVIVQGKTENHRRGIISFGSQTFAQEQAYYLYSDLSYEPNNQNPNKYMKMEGRKIYEFALNNVPPAMKEVFDKTGLPISDLKKIFIHQANAKMDEAILNRFYRCLQYVLE